MKTLAVACAILAAAFVVSRIERPPLYAGVAWSTAYEGADGKLLRVTLSSDEKYRLYRPLAEMPKDLIDATLLHEDRQFYRHPGVNPVALARAAFSTYGGGARLGGSTLTMQLARIRYGLRTQGVAGKLVQILRALELEWFYSKDEILEAYLNLAPYGGNIEGAAAAGLIYFDKEQLSLEESLALTPLPQSPSRRDPKRELRAWDKAHRRFLAEWNAVYGATRPASAEVAITFRGAGDLPFLAPHFVAAIGEKQGTVRTTLDTDKQRLLERKLKAYVNEKRHQGIDNAAALLVDARTLGVVAEIGSVEFSNVDILGQVNGTTAKRSPGSTLKPFIYALAIDEGMIHPETRIKDAPMRFSGFNPENFDGEFKGPLSATQALTHSRNVPAVALMHALPPEHSLHALLSRANIRDLKPEPHYGLALALGGAELTMHELAALYAAIRNGGMHQPTARIAGARGKEPVRLVSPEAAFLVQNMLQTTTRPELGGAANLLQAPLEVSWKTGTSHGFRDAWTVGIAGPYVLAVWVGRFDGRGNNAFIGIKAAAPLFFRVIDALRASEKAWPVDKGPAGLNLTRVHVCSVSGKLPSDACPHAIPSWFIPGKSPIETCEVHRPVLVDNASGKRVCRFDPRTTHVEVFEFWPSDIASLFRRAGLPRRAPPAASAECVDAGHGPPPRITSPQPELVYQLRSRAPTPLPLSAIMDSSADALYWFADQRYLGRAGSNEVVMWQPNPGAHVVRAVDSLGRVAAQTVRVEQVD